jgi:cell shape-determining protein MreC
MDEDKFIRLDDDDSEDNFDELLSEEEYFNIFDVEEFDDETISSLIDEVHNSLDAIEEVMVNMYFSYAKQQEEYKEHINNLELENEKYREELEKLYQELASNSKKKKKKEE